ncbi:hypothetical protein LRR18_18540, partial [Mangrovimonas sp. AS39]|uniref:hypothetical protein n=1 Tax=Mangrovimonas futianensis TaxID=2895523 RepID=UPI001E658545
DIPFIDENDGPFGSISRQINVEVSKKDENHPLFGIETRWGHIEVVYSYKSNKDGDILSRKRKYQIWKKDKSGVGYTSYIPGISMLLFVLSDFF